MGRWSGHHATVTSASHDDRQAAADPVLVRRRRMARGAVLAKRVGYALFGLAVVLFFVGFAIGLNGGLVAGILVCMGVGSVLLAPAIVIGYAVKAADRDDRERGFTR